MGPRGRRNRSGCAGAIFSSVPRDSTEDKGVFVKLLAVLPVFVLTLMCTFYWNGLMEKYHSSSFL